MNADFGFNDPAAICVHQQKASNGHAMKPETKNENPPINQNETNSPNCFVFFLRLQHPIGISNCI